eukprot:6395172-Pyramimonas_sp.AAC.1
MGNALALVSYMGRRRVSKQAAAKCMKRKYMLTPQEVHGSPRAKLAPWHIELLAILRAVARAYAAI